MGWWGKRITAAQARVLLARSPGHRPTASRSLEQIVAGENEDDRNGLERLYGAEMLELQRLAGEIQWYRFGSLSLRLAKRTWYRVDYQVGCNDGVIEIHEVKGHWEDDARVKIKVAARMFPEYRFVAVQNKGTKARPEWAYEAIPSA